MLDRHADAVTILSGDIHTTSPIVQMVPPQFHAAAQMGPTLTSMAREV